MEYIKITRVDNVILHRRGKSVKGTLHLTTHHLIFTMPAPPPPPQQNGSNSITQASVANRELWLCYPMIEKLDFNKGSAMLFKQHYSGVTHKDNIETGSAYTENNNNNSDDSNNSSSKSRIDKNQQLQLQDRNTTNTKNDSTNRNSNGGFKENGLNIYDKSYLRGSNLRFCCKDFTYLAFDFEDFNKGKAVFDSVMRLCCLDTIEKVYAFIYSPVRIELPFNSWKDYNILNEFERQGLFFQSALQNSTRNSGNSGNWGNSGNGFDLNGKLGQTRWRVTNLNKDYKLCPSYPSTLIVPRIISDSVLGHSVRFRSKNRFPALSYYYKKNGCTITRCSQPLVGIKQNRSFQDEKLLNEIFKTNNNVNYDNNNDNNTNGNTMTSKRNRKFNLIVDCRPLSNAVAQTALGAGTEIMDNYDDCKKIFLNIDNIHVIRDSLNKVREVLKNGDISTNLYNKELLYKSNWLKHISTILTGVDILVKSMVLNNNHLLIHCSDGWDRTTQISSLVQICLDPYYRTIDGFVILIEKEWLSFGHRFNERCGHLQNETKFHDNIENLNSNQATQAFRQVTNHFKHKKSVKFVSPIFQQFLDCIYQLIRQYPNKFEYNERFLRRLVYHLYSCQYGTFLFDCERERKEHDVETKTRSVWDYFKSRKIEFSNPNYIKEDVNVKVNDNDGDDNQIIYPKVKDVKFWFQLFGKSDGELNYNPYGFENSGGEYVDSNLDSSSSNSAIGSITKSKDINSNGIINGNGGTEITNSIGDSNIEESLIDTSIITKNVENVFDILKQSTADVFSQFTSSVNGVTNNIGNSLSDSMNDSEKSQSQELKETQKLDDLKERQKSQMSQEEKLQQHEAIIHSVPAKALIALEDEDEAEESGDKDDNYSDGSGDKDSSDSDTTIKNVDNGDIKKIVSDDNNNDNSYEREKELARRLSEFEISTEEDEIALENQLRNN